MKVVITTIQPPTPSIRKLYRRLSGIQDATLIVIGDAKGPDAYAIDDSTGELADQNTRVEFLSLDKQLESELELAHKLPTGHYARKNIGYIQAIKSGAQCIYETDDDNSPLPAWSERTEYIQATARIIKKKNNNKWVNVYRYFSKEKIWPRGLPLDEIWADAPEAIRESEPVRAPIQQGLVNNSPDVDAIWRLVMDRPFEFENSNSVYLEPGNWCPFNTQSTWWWPVAYPLLYIPSFCSFRMCDIWKSFVAQRCLWELGLGITFHAPEVIQDRNVHDLMDDFREEMPGYLQNREICNILEQLQLDSGEDALGHNLLACYKALVENEIFPEKELLLVNVWLEDLGKIDFEI